MDTIGDCSCLPDAGSWEFQAKFIFPAGTEHYFVPVQATELINCQAHHWSQLDDRNKHIQKLSFGSSGDGPIADRWPGVVNALPRSTTLSAYTPISYPFREAYVQLTRAIKAGSRIVMSVHQDQYGSDEFAFFLQPPTESGAGSERPYPVGSHKVDATIIDAFSDTPEPGWLFGDNKGWANPIYTPGVPLRNGGADATAQATSEPGGTIKSDTEYVRMHKPLLYLGLSPEIGRWGAPIAPTEILRAFANQTQPGVFDQVYKADAGWTTDENGMLIQYERTYWDGLYKREIPGLRLHRGSIGPPGTVITVRGTVFELEGLK